MKPIAGPILAALLVSSLLVSSLAAAPAFAGGAQRLAQAKETAQEPATRMSPGQALYLIRSTLLTLNDANRSGNYTVLRDLAAPGFRSGNTAADLSQHFTDLRRRKFDLHAVAALSPQLTQAPRLDANRMLRLTGFFPTKPLQISFDLLFQEVGGLWMLFGISVATPQAPGPQPAAQAKPPGK